MTITWLISRSRPSANSQMARMDHQLSNLKSLTITHLSVYLPHEPISTLTFSHFTSLSASAATIMVLDHRHWFKPRALTHSYRTCCRCRNFPLQLLHPPEMLFVIFSFYCSWKKKSQPKVLCVLRVCVRILIVLQLRQKPPALFNRGVFFKVDLQSNRSQRSQQAGKCSQFPQWDQ